MAAFPPSILIPPRRSAPKDIGILPESNLARLPCNGLN
jgi:hypothetical protein